MATGAQRKSREVAKAPAPSRRRRAPLAGVRISPTPKASTVSAKGWVVIPKEIRERHGLKKGDRVRFMDIGGTISVVPIRPGSGRGMLKGGRPWAELLEEKRRELEEEERDLAPPRPR